jgi:Ni,Fe-hydrogenase III large subunit
MTPEAAAALEMPPRLDGVEMPGHRPWPRRMVETGIWSAAAAALDRGSLTLVALWGEPAAVHMAVAAPESPAGVTVLTLACPDGRYPSVAACHAPAQRPERAVADLFGLVPVGLPDPRPWLDHGVWGVAAPLASVPRTAGATAAYPFLPVDGGTVHHVVVGPVHAGIIEPGQFRFSADGETVVRLEERLGYTHKGLEGLLAGARFGHRLMMDRIVPGGVTVDLDRAGQGRIAALVRMIRQRFRPLVALYDKTSSLQDRMVGTGILRPALAARFGAGGPIGRASGRRCDARRWPGYGPYPSLTFAVPVLTEGDVNARVWLRIREIEESLGLIEQILERLPGGPVLSEPSLMTAGEGVALVEGFRGDVFAWVRLDAAGRIDRCHLRDPSWFQWPLLEAVIEGNIIADFPLCNKSFNCSYSGHDL